MLAQLLAFLGVAVVVICVPGPDTALTLRNTLAGGRRCGAATAAGVAIGQTVWTLATGVGIAELIQASEPALLAMKAVGAPTWSRLGCSPCGLPRTRNAPVDYAPPPGDPARDWGRGRG